MVLFTVVGSIALVSSPSIVLASASGASSTSAPSTVVDDNTGHVGTVVWSNPSNARVSDDNYATAVLSQSGDQDSHYLKATGFGFAIPAYSTIDGIQVSVERSVSGGAQAGNAIRDNGVQLLRAGTIDGSDLSNSGSDWPTIDTVAVYGGTGNLWGTSWTVSDINNVNFGVDIAAHHHGGSGDATDTARVDSVSITVTYTPPPSTTTTVSAVSATYGGQLRCQRP